MVPWGFAIIYANILVPTPSSAVELYRKPVPLKLRVTSCPNFGQVIQNVLAPGLFASRFSKATKLGIRYVRVGLEKMISQ